MAAFVARIVRHFLVLVNLRLLDLNSKGVAVARGLDHLEDPVLHLDAVLGHENVAFIVRGGAQLGAEGPASSLHRGLGTIVV